MPQQVIFTENPAAELDRLTTELNPSKVFIITDSNTSRLVLPRLTKMSLTASEATVIEVAAGDEHKSIDAAAHIWQRLIDEGATRQSVIINLGGGMVTDLGGFAASTFKRGLRFINIPTTLLGAVDAAVGGKTGINFSGLKNEVGVFNNAEYAIVSACYFDTLPASELLSGYGEVLKHALLDSTTALDEALSFDFTQPATALLPMLQRSVEVKRRIVADDPHEHGLRKALNLGHTVAHAFEALAFERGRHVAHGHAVAWGLVVDLILSHMQLRFPSVLLHRVSTYVADNFPRPGISCNDYPAMIEFMRHDKKNASPETINFTLLRQPGDVATDRTASPEDIATALDIFRDLLHI